MRTFKLVDRDGQLLGLITLDERIADEMERRGGTERLIHLGHVLDCLFPSGLHPDPVPIECERVVFYRSRNSREGVCCSLSPERLEQLEGFTFTPSVAYVKRLAAEAAELALADSIKRRKHPLFPHE